MEKRNVIEPGRTPGFVKTAAAADSFEKRAKDVFSAFRERKPEAARPQSKKKPS